MPTARPPPPEIPKSPPKWPLRPGVLVHVKCDTKQNLCANRIQSPNTSSTSTSTNLNVTNVSYASPLINTNSKNTSVNGDIITTKKVTPKVPELPARNATPPIIVAIAPKSATVKAIISTEIATVRPTTCVTANEQIVNEQMNKTATVKRLQSTSSQFNKKIDTTENENDNNNMSGGNTVVDIGTSVINKNTIDILRPNNGNIGGDGDMNDAETTLMVTNQSTTVNNNVNANCNNDELMHFTTSSLIERIMGRLRWRREHNKHSNQNNSNSNNNKKGMGIASLLPYSFTSNNAATTQNNQQQQSITQITASCSSDNEESIFSRSNKRAVNLLRATGWFGSGKSTNSSTGLMSDKRHHLSGITCSDGGK